MNKLTSGTSKATVLQWGKLLTITGGAQALVQGLGLLVGVLIIRLLPKEEYAFYTIANTMLGTMTVLADGGINNGAMAAGGEVWQDRYGLGKVLRTSIHMRKKFAVYSLIVTIPILIYLLNKQDAPWTSILLITLALIPSFWAALSDSLLQTVPKLHQAIPPLQKNQLLVSLMRLFFSGVFVFLFPFTFIAVLGNGIPRLIGNFRLHKIAAPFIDEAAPVDKKIEARIMRIVRRTLPGPIYYCISGQITVWILSFFGNTGSIASVGALSRLAMVLTLISTVVSTLVIPRFSRLKPVRSNLLKKYILIFLGLSVVLLIFIAVTYGCSDWILLILGDKYKGLNFELVLTIIGSAFSLLSGVAFGLYSNRGWVIHPVVMIMVNLISIILFVNVMDVTSLVGVLQFNIAINMISFLMNFIFGFFKILKLRDI